MKEKEKTGKKKAKKVKKTSSSGKVKKTKAKSSTPVEKKKSQSKASLSSTRKKSTSEPGRRKSKRAQQQDIPLSEVDTTAEEGITNAIMPADGAGALNTHSVSEKYIVNEEGIIFFPSLDEEDEEITDDDYLLFRYAGEGYAFRVSDVHEILRHQRISRVPRSASHVIGATSLRGVIIPVVSLGSLLMSVNKDLPVDGRILLLRKAGIKVGVLVEKEIGIKSFKPESLLPPPSSTGTGSEPFVEGVFDVDGDLFTVLRPDAITGTKATGRLDEKEA